MHLLDICVRFGPREGKTEPVFIAINPLSGTTIMGTNTLFPSEIELLNAINVLLKERRHHIQQERANGSDGN